MANAIDILNAVTALRTPKTAPTDKKLSAIKAIATVLIEASNNSLIQALIQPTEDELKNMVDEANAALTLVNEHRDELTAVQIDQILQGLRNAYAEADRRAMDGLTDKFDEKPDATTIADAVSEDEPEYEAEGSDDFDPENDLELQDDTPAEEDELTKNIRKLAEKAPKVVDLLKEIFG
jgi:hypothetical protein